MKTHRKSEPKPKWSDFGDSDLVGEFVMAALLCISVFTARSWRSATPPRGPRWVRIGALCRYRVGDLRKYIERNTAPTADDPDREPSVRKTA